MLIKIMVNTRGNDFGIDPDCFREAVEMVGLTDEMKAAYPHS